MEEFKKSLGGTICIRADTGATIIGEPVMRAYTLETRSPMVSSDGKTLSNGRVSHEGKRWTEPGKKKEMSSASLSASSGRGVTMRNGPSLSLLRFAIRADRNEPAVPVTAVFFTPFFIDSRR